MRRFCLFLLILPAIAFAPSAKSPVAKQLKDYKVFEKVLVSKEGRLDLHQSADSMYLYLSELRTNLSEEQTLIEQFKSYSVTLAKLGCGHTQIHPNQYVISAWVRENKSLPVDFIMQGKRLFTNKLLTSDYEIINMDGSNRKRVRAIKGNYEILSLDHKTVSEMMGEIAPYISSDEGGIDFKYHQVAQLFEFYRHMSAPFSADSISIQYVKGNDTISTYLGLGAPPVNTINSRLQKALAADAKIEKEIGTFAIKNAKIGVFRFRSLLHVAEKNMICSSSVHFKKSNRKKSKR